jgi:hypothetical protein
MGSANKQEIQKVLFSMENLYRAGHSKNRNKFPQKTPWGIPFITHEGYFMKPLMGPFIYQIRPPKDIGINYKMGTPPGQGKNRVVFFKSLH